MAATRPASPLRRRVAGAAVAATAVLGLIAAVVPQATASPGRQAAEGPILHADAPGAIDNSFVVLLDTSEAGSRTPEGRAVAKRYGATIERTYSAALNGYAVTLSEAKAKQLAADPAVEAVVQNRTFSIAGTQPNPPSWGLDRIDQKSLPLNGGYTYPDSAGRGVTAYIIDTGVRISHTDFGGRASYGYDAIDGDNTAQDGHGHGTHVAGTVGGTSHGVAKQAKIVGVRVLNNVGQGTTAQVVAGVDWVTRNAVKPAVANMSLGGTADTAIDTAVRNSIAAGITYAVAAGNDSRNASDYSPARVPQALTVGSTTSGDGRSSFSNFGSALDLFAPGSSITSTWNTSDTATNTISGTSMASPHVAGAAALYLADHPTATPDQVAQALTSAASTAVVGNPGAGSPNRLLNVTGGSTKPPGPRFENTADYAINDNATTESPIDVTGISGNAPAALSVSVDIKHTYVGDLQVELVAPDGTAYRLKEYDTGGSSDNLLTSYSVNATAEAANGVWRLRVSDNWANDTGKIDAWSLQF